MHRQITRAHDQWFHAASADMELLVFGHAGPPVVVFSVVDGRVFHNTKTAAWSPRSRASSSSAPCS